MRHFDGFSINDEVMFAIHMIIHFISQLDTLHWSVVVQIQSQTVAPGIADKIGFQGDGLFQLPLVVITNIEEKGLLRGIIKG